jgi:putative glutathione S-transferase
MGRNMLVDGEWQTDVEPRTVDGAFERVTTRFRETVRDDPGASYPAQPGRYHLYVARSCPWAHGTALVRRLCGLTDAVSLDVVDSVRDHEGWEFAPEKDGCTPDTANGFEYLREAYAAADPSYTGRVTVPVLWDKREETIVNNESVEIMRMLQSAFADHGNGVDLYPEGYRDEVDRVIGAIYDPINDGVYRVGFAGTQAAYDAAVDDLFAALDHWDSVLEGQRYLAGDRLTLADVRLFPTLVRFDRVYHTGFKCDRRFLHQYETLWAYLRDLYGTPGFAETTRFDHIAEGYYRSDTFRHPYGIVATGPDLDFEASHDRDRLTGGPPSALVG